MPYFSNAFQIISMTFHCVSLKNKDLYRYMYNGLINCIIWILVYAPVAPVTPLHWKIRFYSNHVQRETTHLSLLSKIEIIYCIFLSYENNKLWQVWIQSSCRSHQNSINKINRYVFLHLPLRLINLGGIFITRHYKHGVLCVLGLASFHWLSLVQISKYDNREYPRHSPINEFTYLNTKSVSLPHGNIIIWILIHLWCGFGFCIIINITYRILIKLLLKIFCIADPKRLFKLNSHIILH